MPHKYYCWYRSRCNALCSGFYRLTGQCEEPSCHNLSSCEDCTDKSRCMWCESEKQCVSTSAYAVNFPFGQCRGWVQDQCSGKSQPVSGSQVVGSE